MATPTHRLKIVGVVAIVATGLIHLWTARDSFGEATYKGLLFVANGGLPGLPAEPDVWLEPLGVASLVAEVVFLLAFAVTRTMPRRPLTPHRRSLLRAARR
jgi:hypothetical protein